MLVFWGSQISTAVLHWRNAANALSSLKKTTYTYIKNTIGAVAEELGAEGYNTDKNKKRNEGSYIMDSSYSDMEKLLNRSRTLADQSGKEAQR